MSKRGLGRGLSALIPEIDPGDRESVVELAVDLIEPNPRQPRKHFDEGKLEELASSIRAKGIVQPIVVRPRDGRYEIVAGERRWRAAKLAGLKRVPALVRDFSEAEVMEIALIENLQREDLNPLEEAEAYRVLLEECHLTQEELARRLGKSRPQISNTLRLLQLAEPVREELRAGRISVGHAKVLLGVSDPALQERLAARVAQEGLSVRELEAAVKRQTAGSRSARRGRESREDDLTPELRDIERRLGERLGTPVKLQMGKDRGRIEITFFGEEGLERVLECLGLLEGKPATPVREVFRV
ncbi:MAG TPA: ParB/RepB/Spo0J family partition protein [Symbiobacteriaceae bacterium]